MFLLDQDPVKCDKAYRRKKQSQELFKSAKSHMINAEINEAYNIIKKAIPKAFNVDGIEGVGHM